MIAIRTALILAALALLAAPTAQATECNPRSARDWATRCVTDRSSVEDLVDEIRRFPGLAHLDSFSDVRELLVTGSLSDDCRRALRQLLAAALNLASGRLSGDCCVEHSDGRTVSLREALHRHAENCAARRDCGDALRFLRRINDASWVHACGDRDDRDDDSSDDGSSDDGSSDDDSSVDDSSDDDSSDDGSSDDGSDEDDCCRPRSRGWWHRQCLGADRVSPTKGNSQAKGPGAHPQLSEEDRDQAIRRARRRLGRAELRPCSALDSKNLGGQRGKAEAEVAAFALNWGAGYLDGCGRAERMLDRSIRALDQGDWQEAWQIAHDGNHAKGLRRCADDSDGDSDGDSAGKAKSNKPSKGKGKGKKKK